MEPIISPWIIYVFSIIVKIDFIIKLIAILSLFGICSLYVLLIDKEDEKTIFTLENWMKKLFIILIICGILLIFIPDKQTLLTMLTLNSITPDNIQLVQGDVVEFIYQIMNIIK